MAISRFQMNRQLRAYGGIMGQDGRRNYGIGSFFQEKIMDPIKKVVKSLKKASQSHKRQAKTLSRIIKKRA